MSIETPKRKQRHVCYKARELKIYEPIEETLMTEHGLTYSDLMKKGVKHLWNQHQTQKALIL
tara:strand:+ start:672 stop:857 length:186 start_codon:yes stop_codon:yes gene_type:complete